MGRDEKKELLKNKIVETAKAVFKEHGYANTTISMISKQASIGRGTIYNYYHSKADLFVSIILGDRDSFHFDEKKLDKLIRETQSPLALIQDLLITNILVFRDLSKRVWSDIIGASLYSSGDREYLNKHLASYSRRIIDSFYKIFVTLKDEKMLSDSFDCHKGAKIIYNITVSETINYLFFDDIPYEDFIDNIRSFVEFSFADKLIEKSGS